ncbi:hypothetical protein [Allomesorhizobium alhagi]|jgi:hypothetical protein|uniref:hypothetical protein n=1 Tax=Allomesorhizobium alhagi TaxID=475067 RepID=UPI00111275D5|nr:hypothetical protein [Mesorhizobium alhagi]
MISEVLDVMIVTDQSRPRRLAYHSPRYEAELPRFMRRRAADCGANRARKLKPGTCCRSEWQPTGDRKSRVDLAATGRPFDRELFSIEKCRKNHRITFLCGMVKFWPEKLTKTKEVAMKDYFSFQLFMRMSTALFVLASIYSMATGNT